VRLGGVPRELATDSDRILPGDGDFQLPPIMDHLRRIGYRGWVSVELMNPTCGKQSRSKSPKSRSLPCAKRLV